MDERRCGRCGDGPCQQEQGPCPRYPYAVAGRPAPIPAEAVMVPLAEVLRIIREEADAPIYRHDHVDAVLRALANEIESRFREERRDG